MKDLYKQYLFSKKILVSEGTGEKNSFECLIALAELFGIRITEGKELCETQMIRCAEYCLGRHVPPAFYEGFPKTVREMSHDKLLFDQLFHYFNTYGMGNFSEAGHSVFEEEYERKAFRENVRKRDFRIIKEEEALKLLPVYVDDLLKSTRSISAEQYLFVKEYIVDNGLKPDNIASKNTAYKLLCDTRDLYFARFISLSDVVKLAEWINFFAYGNRNVKKLNLKNTHRKLIVSLIDYFTAQGKCNIKECYEKKKVWNGLLHHIHYKAKNEAGQRLLDAMRGRGNESVYSEFEQNMSDEKIVSAVECLKTGKSSAAFLRKLDYIVSRCKTPEELDYVIGQIDSQNLIVLLQLYIKYCTEAEEAADSDFVNTRSFSFLKFEQLLVYNETFDEAKRRKSFVKPEQAEIIRKKLYENIERLLKNRLGRVYIDPDMSRYALPLQEGASQGGFGVLTKGSRIHIGEVKKIRAFTYWEKVDDIDLSVFGLGDNGANYEFSWRTMAELQSPVILYSGDQTSGYNGGSEYFDIDTEQFRKEYPDVRYLIFSDNVYSAVNFESCICRAGYMLRDTEDSGEVFEPKTVKSSFTINCASTFAHLFGIDLDRNDFVWLNLARSGGERVAASSAMSFLKQYFITADVMNMKKFFELMASELVSDIASADVVVTDKDISVPEGKILIREYDFEKMLKLMNQ